MVVVVVVNVNGSDESIKFKNGCERNFAEATLSKYGPGLLLGEDDIVVDTPTLPEGHYRYRLITQPQQPLMAPKQVQYNVQPLNPESDDMTWIDLPIEPIPIGRDFEGGLTSSKVHYLSQTYVNGWLFGAVGGGEESQIFRNDGILRAIMLWAGISPTSFVRNSNVTTVIGATRPDFTALHHGVPVLIVEEKDSIDIDGARGDIVSKFRWIPNIRRLPFFIGIAFCVRSLEVLILRRNEAPMTLFTGNCESLEERLAFLAPAVNIARVLKHFCCLVRSSSLTMNQWHQREGGKQLRLGFDGVEIKCPLEVYHSLVEFYQATKTQPHVPNLEYMHGHLHTAAHGFIHLKPLGIQCLPESIAEFCFAIQCILAALYRLHLKGYLHTDIRWPNIVQVMDGSWFLIDCYYMCRASDQRLCRDRALQRGKTDGEIWTKADDIRQICNLFATAGPWTTNISVQNVREKLESLKKLSKASLNDLNHQLQQIISVEDHV